MQAAPGRREPRRRRRLLPPALAAAIIIIVAVILRAVFLLLVPLHHGVVEGEEWRQVRGDQRAAGGPPPRPCRLHAAALVEEVLRLGDLLGGRLGCSLGQAREGFGLAGVEIREAPPAISFVLGQLIMFRANTPWVLIAYLHSSIWPLVDAPLGYSHARDFS